MGGVVEGLVGDVSIRYGELRVCLQFGCVAAMLVAMTASGGYALCPPGDLTGDCHVDFEDMAIIAGEWLEGEEWEPGWLPPEDTSNTVVVSPGDDVAGAYAWLVSSDRDAEMGELSIANPRTLILAPGQHVISSPLRLKSYTNLTGISGAVIRLADHTNDDMIRNADQVGGNSHIGVHNLILDGNYRKQSNGDIVEFIRTDYVDVTGVQFRDARLASINLETCENFQILGCRLDGGRTHGMLIDAKCQHGEIADVLLENTFYGIQIRDSNDMHLADFEIRNFHNEALVINRLDGNGCRRITVSNGNIHDGAHVYVTGASYAAGTQRITGLPGDFVNLIVYDRVTIMDPGYPDPNDYAVAEIAEDGSYIKVPQYPGPDSTGDITVILEPMGGHFLDSSDLQFNNLLVDTIPSTGLKLERAAGQMARVGFANCSFLNCTSDKANVSGITAWGVEDMRFDGCVFKGNDDNGVHVYGGQRITMSGCLARDNGVVGVKIDSCNDVSISGSQMLDNLFVGLGILRGSDHVTVSGCRLGNSTGSTAQDYGIDTYSGVLALSPDAIVRVADSDFEGNVISPAYDAVAHVLTGLATSNTLGRRAHAASYTITAGDLGYIITNGGAVATTTLTLPPATPGLAYEIRNAAGQGLRVQPATGESLSQTVGGPQLAADHYTESAGQGAYIILACYESGRWNCQDVFGAWAASP